MQNYAEETLLSANTPNLSGLAPPIQSAYQGDSERVALPEHVDHAFANPFQIEDLLIFDQPNLARILALGQISPEHLACSLHEAPSSLIRNVFSCLSLEQRSFFEQVLFLPVKQDHIAQARHLLLDKLFWELTYWKTPSLYEELVSGEHLHPGIFRQLEPLLRDKIVLDAGAGCGRATFEALEHGAALVYAVEPSPGLRGLLAEKLATPTGITPVVLRDGDFTHIPLPDQSVDIALACSAFTAEPAQGGEPGLAELKRVTRIGGFVVLIWPRVQDRSWLAEHGFRYVTFPVEKEMTLSFASWESAWRCTRRFYAQNKNVFRYLRHARHPGLPFSVLDCNPPCDYGWLQVK